MNRLPRWLQNRQPESKIIHETQKLLGELKLDTVCRQAHCPNRKECYGQSRATFLILGPTCSRSCAFCAVQEGELQEPDPQTPQKIARAAEKMELEHVVITSVTRDDLPLGGAGQFARCVNQLKDLDINLSVEVLTPDFQLNYRALNKVLTSEPDIYNHNVETIPRLYSDVRPEADYERSLAVLNYVKKHNKNIITKSGLMVGLGEKESEIKEVMRDLLKAGCEVLTVGQYLRPSRSHYPVADYIKPEKFKEYEKVGKKMGFKYIKAGPLVRSSYQAGNIKKEIT